VLDGILAAKTLQFSLSKPAFGKNSHRINDYQRNLLEIVGA